LIQYYDTDIASKKLHDDLVQFSYVCGRYDNNQEGDVDLRALYYTKDFKLTDPFVENILSRIELCGIPVPTTECYSVYVNVLKFGDAPVIHCDCAPHIHQGYTMMVYLNSHWHPNYGGETIFYDDELEIYKSILPKPGRVVIFDGRIPHSARTPTPYYLHNRYVLIFKYKGIMGKEIPGSYDCGISGFDPITVKELLYE
tara:strand:+ start:15973 stop:16569 length:597 start_codon:yes stop_codon:yes gene_type:complete